MTYISIIIINFVNGDDDSMLFMLWTAAQIAGNYICSKWTLSVILDMFSENVK